jgi:hypothetical protein
MVVLIFNNQLFNDHITSLPIDDSPETQVGLHAEEIPCLQQEIGVATVQTDQDSTGAVDDARGVPPYLKRKLPMRHDGTIRSLFDGIPQGS